VPGQAEAEVAEECEMLKNLDTDFSRVRAGLAGPVNYGDQQSMSSAFGLQEALSLMDGNAVERMRLQMEEGLAQDMRVAAPSPKPHVWRAVIGEPWLSEAPFRRQMSCATLVGRADPQARRELCWRATIGDCFANATRPSKGATG